MSNQHAAGDNVLYMDEQTLRRTSMATVEKFSPLKKQKNFVFWNKTRLIILGIVTIALTICVSNAMIFNFTVICLNKDHIATFNGTTVTESKPMFSETERSWLLSMIAVGTIFGTLPITYLVSLLGIRNMFTLYGLISALSVFIFPLAAEFGYYPVLLVRMVQGVAITASWSVFGAVIAEWAELNRSGTAVAYLSCHLQLAPMFTMPVSAALCETSWGWSWAYYLHGFVTLAVFVLFYWMYRDSPAMHPNVSEQELKVIQEGKIIRINDGVELEPVPYKAIFTDKCILHFDVEGTGFAAALPFFLSMLGKFIGGPISDTLPGLTDKQRVIAFASFSQFLLAAAYFGLAFMPEGAVGLGQFCYSAVIALSGLDTVSVLKSCQLISGRFVHVLMSVNSLNESLTLFGLAAAVSIFVPNNTSGEWSKVFIFMGVMMTVFTIIFNFTTEVTARPWARETAKVAPEAQFDIRAEQLAHPHQVEKMIHDRRMSIQSHQSNLPVGSRRPSILSLTRIR
ncbi:unnamed protein product [Bursaphelenchus okinawaensis]|uniref:Major facilitator superfamily (MFS) profile domain-containing protein n=1 Tax=Bursaphelenchus okinawaensis TaxID=465554 RepID=A0A811JWK6_9BILA|nr:unnamed protein product [Bursaphelenchus okinawaensis]CAG9086250.1 unnamed protein product [Bursaphelenchus okinawaensis]